MGQQQLLLIVLGVIVVGIAVVVGINLFNANSVSANRDGVVSDLNNLGAMAQQYYKKPTAMGGGGNSFTGWTLPKLLESTANGSYVSTAPVVTATLVTLTGVGNETGDDGSTKVTHVARVYADSIVVSKSN
jgi:hypothetical protein